MISLTIFQAFVTDILNLFEISIVYRLMVQEIRPKYIILDCLVSLILVSMPLSVSTVQLVLIVIYYWLCDRINSHPNIITNSIIGLICASIIPFMFDIIDHFTFNFIRQRSIAIFGWLLPLFEMIIVIIIILLVKYVASIQRNLQWFKETFHGSVQLWHVMVVFFLSYITLTFISEQEGIANKYALLLFSVYFSILLVGSIGFVSLIRSYQQNAKQEKLINDYKTQIEYIQQLNKQYTKFRRERHDIRNLLLDIQGYIREKDFEKSELLLKSILKNKDSSKSFFYVDHSLLKLKIAGMRNIIKEKSYQIVENNIPLSIEINAEVSSVPGSEIITARIIGILLDNAIEAVINQKDPFIQLAILKHSGKSLELVVSNSLEHPLNINQAMVLGETEKKGHQGIGLSNVSELVNNDDRYSFSVEVEKKKVTMSCFVQERKHRQC